jgi:hypothetical protein
LAIGRFEINSRKPPKNPKTGNRVLFDHESTGGEETDNEPNEWVFRPLRHPKKILARLQGVEAHYEVMEGWSKLAYDYVSRRSIRPLMGGEMSYVDGSNPLSSVKSPAVTLLDSGLMPLHAALSDKR